MEQLFNCHFGFTGVKTTIIYPATDKHIEKYSSQEIHILQETPELYQSITLPYLKKDPYSLEVSEKLDDEWYNVKSLRLNCRQQSSIISTK